jgi:nucleoside-diphosphate kinase
MERTLVIIKPDGIQRSLVGEIIGRFERRGLRFIAMKMMMISTELARTHYAEHEGKDFFEPLIRFITSGPVIVMILEGDRAIELVRRTIGQTNPAEAEPGTIRGDLALITSRNLIHGSDSPETAAVEIPRFFSPEEIVSLSRDVDRWIFP